VNIHPHSYHTQDRVTCCSEWHHQWIYIHSTSIMMWSTYIKHQGWKYIHIHNTNQTHCTYQRIYIHIHITHRIESRTEWRHHWIYIRSTSIMMLSTDIKPHRCQYIYVHDTYQRIYMHIHERTYILIHHTHRNESRTVQSEVTDSNGSKSAPLIRNNSSRRVTLLLPPRRSR